MPHRNYRPDIDGLRAIAVVAVVAFHAFPNALRGGFTGVDIFFVISGYLISRLIWDGLDDNSFTLLGFYRRRVVRLFPALVVVLAACLVAGWWLLLPSQFATLGKDVAAAAVYSSNFVFWHESGYFATPASLRPLTHLWSLAVEEQFYLLYPLLLIVCARRRALTGGVLAVLFAGSFLVNLEQSATHPSAAFYLLPSRFWELLLGGLVAYARTGVPARLRASMSVAGAGLIVVAVLAPSSASRYPGWWALAPTLAAALIIAAGPSALINRALSWSPLVFIGAISYPLYLWHFPLLVFARLHHGGPLPASEAALLVAASVVLAYVTYRFVERPIRSRRPRLLWKPLPALAAGMAAVACGGLVVNSAQGFVSRLSIPDQNLLGFKYDYRSVWREGTCFLRPEQIATAFTPSCVEQGEKPLVVLYGDSHAAQLYPGLSANRSTRRYRLAEFTASACPPIVGYTNPVRPFCPSINDNVLRRLAALHPYEVILAGAWWAYPDARLDDLAKTVAAIRAAGVKQIVLVGPVPKWNVPLPQALYDYTLKNPGPLPDRMTGLSDASAASDAVVGKIAAALHVGYADPMGVLCNQDGCLTRVGDQLNDLTAWDQDHLTAASGKLVVRLLHRSLLPGPIGG
jgi:peptidoglycan/LPS O-acetylase OafA/YrhL